MEGYTGMENEPKILRDKWADLLESGKYKQGTNFLRKQEDNSFCCLGVLCDMLDPTKWEKTKTDDTSPWEGTSEQPGTEVYSYGTGCVGLPTAYVLNRVGISLDFADSLAMKNDEGESFSDIATVIREYSLEEDEEDILYD